MVKRRSRNYVIQNELVTKITFQNILKKIAKSIFLQRKIALLCKIVQSFLLNFSVKQSTLFNFLDFETDLILVFSRLSSESVEQVLWTVKYQLSAFFYLYLDREPTVLLLFVFYLKNKIQFKNFYAYSPKSNFNFLGTRYLNLHVSLPSQIYVSFSFSRRRLCDSRRNNSF